VELSQPRFAAMAGLLAVGRHAAPLLFAQSITQLPRAEALPRGNRLQLAPFTPWVAALTLYSLNYTDLQVVSAAGDGSKNNIGLCARGNRIG
jgi:hypothetical protein